MSLLSTELRLVPGPQPDLTNLDRVIFDLAPIGMVIVDLDGSIEDVNHSFCETTGYEAQELRTKRIADLVHPEDRAEIAGLRRRLQDGELPYFEMEGRCLARSGRVVHLLLKAGAIQDAAGVLTKVVIQAIDLTERVLAEGLLRHAARHDAITGLPNRTMFMSRLVELQMQQRSHSVLYIDLDQFKIVNDSLGHLAGDQLLVAIARRLEAVVGKEHLLARQGGDDFTLLLVGVNTVEEAQAVANRIHEAFRAPFRIGKREVFTSASIGIAVGSRDYENIEDIVRDADTALYHAKRRGRGRHVVFAETMRTEVLAQLELETDMRRAIDNEEFRVHYQPIVSLQTGAVKGFEALLRWQHPRRGLLNPASFLGLAEDSGQIVAIGLWGLRQVCEQLRRWRASGEDVFVSVNLSHRQFAYPHLADELAACLEQTGACAQGLHLEITETVIMDYGPADIALLSKLRSMGMRLDIDDFGTGHSSLAHLHRLPIDALKIDRSFVSRCGPNGEDLDIVRTIVTLADNLGLEVVAEGVEQPHQRHHLRQLGCQFGQGFAFAHPMEAERASTWVGGRV